MARALGEVLADLDSERRRLSGAPFVDKAKHADRCIELVREGLATLPPELGAVASLMLIRRIDQVEAQQKLLAGNLAHLESRVSQLENLAEDAGLGDGIVM